MRISLAVLLLGVLNALLFGNGSINVYVPGNAGWVSTGVIINSGEFLILNATGLVSAALGVPLGDTPNGPGFGAASSSYIAPGLERYSLVGKIGDNPPFQVGSSFSGVITQSGFLYLAYNDEEYGDNSGGYDVTGNVDSTLPVFLSSLNATVSAEGVAISWKTESEINNIGFHVWRSVGTDTLFNRITGVMIKGAFTSSTRHTYSFVDYRVQQGNLYNYRIESISIAGQSSMSNLISVNFQISSVPIFTNRLLQNYPNPFNPETVLSYELEEQSDVTLKVYTLLGDLVDTIVDEKQNPGFYSYIFRPIKNSTGIFYYILRSNNNSERRYMLFIK